MRINTVLTAFLALGMLTVTFACDSQPGQAGVSGEGQPPTGSATTDADRTGGWIGKNAPGFSLPDTEGKSVDVGKVIGAKPVILVFYRGVW